MTLGLCLQVLSLFPPPGSGALSDLLLQERPGPRLWVKPRARLGSGLGGGRAQLSGPRHVPAQQGSGFPLGRRESVCR